MILCALSSGYIEPMFSVQFDSIRFSNTQFDGSRFGNTQFGGIRFGNTQFVGIRFDNTKFGGIRFDNPEFGGIRISNAQLGRIRFDDIRIGIAQFGNVRFSSVQYESIEFGIPYSAKVLIKTKHQIEREINPSGFHNCISFQNGNTSRSEKRFSESIYNSLRVRGVIINIKPISEKFM